MNLVDLPSSTVGGTNPTGSGYGLGITPDGTQLYLADAVHGLVTILDAATLAVVRTLVVGAVPRNVAFSPDGRLAVVTDGDGRVVFVR